MIREAGSLNGRDPLAIMKHIKPEADSPDHLGDQAKALFIIKECL